MSTNVRLSFFKLNVPDIDRALAFWRAAFGFEVTMSFDEPEFVEHALALPGQENGPSLMLVAFRDGRPVAPGRGHGPVGFETGDIEGLRARALDAGARALGDIFAVGTVKVAMLEAPGGHQIELVQLQG